MREPGAIDGTHEAYLCFRETVLGKQCLHRGAHRRTVGLREAIGLVHDDDRDRIVAREAANELRV